MPEATPKLPPLGASASEPHLVSWRTSGKDKVEALKKHWEPRLPLRPSIREELTASHTRQRFVEDRRDATQPNRAEIIARRKAARRAAPDAHDDFTSAVLKCELAVSEAVGREQVRSVGGAPSNGTAEECLRALQRLSELVPEPFRPCMTRVASALEPCVFSAEHTDDLGRRLAHAQVLPQVASKQISEAQTNAHLAQWQLTRALGSLERVETRLAEAVKQLAVANEAVAASDASRATSDARAEKLQKEKAALERAVAEARSEGASAFDARVSQANKTVSVLAEEAEAERRRADAAEEQLAESVPKEDYEALLEQQTEAARQQAQLQQSLDEQWRAISDLEEELQREVKEKADALSQLQQLRAVSTPRPAWAAEASALRTQHAATLRQSGFVLRMPDDVVPRDAGSSADADTAPGGALTTDGNAAPQSQSGAPAAEHAAAAAAAAATTQQPLESFHEATARRLSELKRAGATEEEAEAEAAAAAAAEAHAAAKGVALDLDDDATSMTDADVAAAAAEEPEAERRRESARAAAAVAAGAAAGLSKEATSAANAALLSRALVQARAQAAQLSAAGACRKRSPAFSFESLRQPAPAILIPFASAAHASFRSRAVSAHQRRTTSRTLSRRERAPTCRRTCVLRRARGCATNGWADWSCGRR